MNLASFCQKYSSSTINGMTYNLFQHLHAESALDSVSGLCSVPIIETRGTKTAEIMREKRGSV
jgi:hypothetical protein